MSREAERVWWSVALCVSVLLGLAATEITRMKLHEAQFSSDIRLWDSLSACRAKLAEPCYGPPVEPCFGPNATINYSLVTIRSPERDPNGEMMFAMGYVDFQRVLTAMCREYDTMIKEPPL